MAFVYQAATRFDNLLSGSSKPNVEASIAEIAANGGIK